jgi:hypothetical protein
MKWKSFSSTGCTKKLGIINYQNQKDANVKSFELLETWN